MNERDRENIRRAVRMAEGLFHQAMSSKPAQEIKREVDSILRSDPGRPPVYDPPPFDPPAGERPRPHTPPPAPPPPPRPAVKAPAVSVAGILMIIFGFLFALPFASFLLFCIVGMAVTPGDFAMWAALLAALGIALGGSVFLIVRGFLLCGRNRRLRAYCKEIGSGEFCPVSLLAGAVGRDDGYVARDLQKMIRRGAFPGARLDQSKTTLILDPGTYQRYLRAKEEDERRRAQEQRVKQEKEREPEMSAELRAAVEEGTRYIRRINEINVLIPGEEISRKMDRLERVTARIFETVRRHPEKLPEIRKFMSYYLPTTVKLLESYREFEQQPVRGGNILHAQREITGALDTVCAAFDRLLDGLYEDAAFDISTDISVLETMLAQEGLTRDFETKTEGDAPERSSI